MTKIYHPNIGKLLQVMANDSLVHCGSFRTIDKLGRICLDILKGTVKENKTSDALWKHRSRAESRMPSVNTIDKWSPALQIRTVLLSIQALLSAPNPVSSGCTVRFCNTSVLICLTFQDDPLNNECAQHYKENLADAQRVSREWTEKYAK